MSDDEVLLEEPRPADTAAHSCSDSEADSADSAASSARSSGSDSGASSDSELADLVEEDADALAGDSHK